MFPDPSCIYTPAAYAVTIIPPARKHTADVRFCLTIVGHISRISVNLFLELMTWVMLEPLHGRDKPWVGKVCVREVHIVGRQMVGKGVGRIAGRNTAWMPSRSTTLNVALSHPLIEKGQCLDRQYTRIKYVITRTHYLVFGCRVSVTRNVMLGNECRIAMRIFQYRKQEMLVRLRS